MDLSGSENKQAFESIAKIFSVKIRYRPIVDLFERLIELAGIAELHVEKLPDLPDIFDKQLIQSAKLYLNEKGLGRQGAGRGGNPAAGQLDESPLASAVMQSADNHCKQIYDGLCILLILYCAEQSSSSSVHEASREIRLSARAIDPRNTLLSGLPALSSTSDSYISTLRVHLQSIESDNAGIAQQKLLYVLQNLTNLQRRRASPSRNQPNISTVFVGTKERFFPNEIKLPGKIKRVYEPSAEPDEPPNSHTVFESNTDTDSEPIVFDFAARRARKWIQNSETLSKVNTTRLNELERAEFVSRLERELKKNFDKSVTGFVLVLVYLLGLEVSQVINTKWSTTGFIDLKGRLIKTLPEPPRIFRSEQGTESSLSYLPLPILVSSWIKQHAEHLIGSDSLLAATGQTESGFVSKVKSLLNSWRQNGNFRFKLSKLAAALSAELTYQTRDPLIITALAGDLKAEPPVMMYYRILKVNELTNAYQKATNALLDIPEDLLGIDFCPRTEIPDKVSGFIGGISNNLISQLKNYPVEITQVHNDLMYFTLAMLMFATGHRPVRDPFCYWNDFDGDDEAVLISDKVISPRHEYRYQALPQIAREQMAVYRRHLRQLSSRLYRGKSLKQQQLGILIITSMEDDRQLLPNFFEIDEAGLEYRSVTQKSMNAYWQQYADISANAGRSMVCQLLLDKAATAGLVELYLGHLNGLSHRHGPRSGHAAGDDFKSLANKVELVLKGLGWKVIKPYKQNRARVELPKNFKKELLNYQKIRVLGPEKRRHKRRERQKKINEIFTSARDSIFTDDDRLFSRQQVEDFFSYIKTNCRQTGLSIHAGMALANCWLWKKKRNGVEVESYCPSRELPAESSVINEKVFRDWQRCKKLSKSIMVELSAKAASMPDEQQSLVELITIAAVFGGLAKAQALKSLPTQIYSSSYRGIGNKVFIDFDELRWVPDVLSLARITFIRKNYTIDQVTTALTGLDNHLCRYLKKHAFMCKKNGVYRKLAELAQSANAMHIPGALQGCWNTKNEGRHLPLHRLTTLLTDKPYLNPSAIDAHIPDEEPVWLPVINTEKTNQRSAKQSWQDVKNIFANIEQSRPIGDEKRNRAQRANLEKQLQVYVEQSDVNANCQILLAWLIERCRKGYTKQNLALSSIKRYASEIFYPILILAGSDIRTFDADEFEALYWECLEFSDSKKLYRLGRLYDLHNFLQIHLALPNISWSALFAFAGLDSVGPSVDANIVTITEYDEAIETIDADAGLTPWLKARYIVVLMLGYRFGLRFSEALNLRHIDVQRDENKIFLQIRGKVYGDLKTRSATRQIPLIGQFNEQEQNAWEMVIAESARWIQLDRQALLFFNGESPREQINKSQIQGYLNKLLKYVCSVQGIHFHHLRHSYANRLMAYAYSLKDPLWSRISHRLIGRFGSQHLPLLWSSTDEATIRLQAIADVMGHASIRTTMLSYVHLHEFLGRAIYNHQYESNVTPKIMANLLGQQESTVRKRRERSRKKDMQTYFVGEPIKEIFPLLSKQLQQATNYNHTWSYNRPENTEITLQLIDRLLVQSARAQYASDLYSNNASADVLEKTLKTAAIVQTKTAFSFYRLPFLDPDAIGSASLRGAKGFQENVLEARRLKTLFVETEQKLTQLAGADTEGNFMSSMNNDFTVWQIDRRYGQSWRFSAISSLSMFLELLSFLPLDDAKFKLILPAAFTLSDDLNAKLRNHPLRFEIASDKQLKKDALIKLVALPPNWKTFQTVNRVLFCLIVWLHFNYDTAI
ncbi:MAG: site-specific integrase [Methylophaga sp.]|uniref:site-specific integrase n=1 Tax=Methylophaga sp. TaxID=2024840 RepID=UPI000C111D90|nr:site-specific integrase [Methylophaga sp.]MBL1458453.1 site-specific integrase [Methylophaga sp.]